MAKKVRAITIGLLCCVIAGAAFVTVRDLLTSQETQTKRPRPISNPNGFAPTSVVAEQPPITEFEVISGKAAGGWVEDDEFVIGVVVEGEPRAYVINTMTGPHREIFNDEISGVALAATW